jgi:hypothetical protein
MKTIENSASIGHCTEPVRPGLQEVGYINYLIAFLMMCICLAEVIHGLWFVGGAPLGTFKRILIPCLVFVPGFLGFAMGFQIKMLSKGAKIGPNAAASLSLSLGTLLVIAYIAITKLAEIAFP